MRKVRLGPKLPGSKGGAPCRGVDGPCGNGGAEIWVWCGMRLRLPAVLGGCGPWFQEHCWSPAGWLIHRTMEVSGKEWEDARRRELIELYFMRGCGLDRRDLALLEEVGAVAGNGARRARLRRWLAERGGKREGHERE